MPSRSRSLSRVLSLSITLGLASACQNPAKDKPKAEVAEAVQIASAAAPSAEAAIYNFSSADSKVSYVGAKVTRKHEGGFGTFSGRVTLSNGKVEEGRVVAEIDMPSLSADDPKLAGHLKSADFFDTEKFPKARFTSTSVQAGGSPGATHTITGNLELKGVTKSVRFPAQIQLSGDNVQVKAEFGINRKDWGIAYPGMPDDLIRDEVLIQLAINAKKA